MNRDIIYLLDRNVVIDIQQYLRDHNVQNIARVKKIDVKSNFVSPILSAIEGRHMRVQSALDMEAAVLEESKLLALFFECTRTDAEFFKDQAGEFAAAFAEENRRKHDDLKELARLFKEKLRQTYKLERCFVVLDEILLLARQYGVPVAHPMVVAAVAALFENKDAHGIIKPKKGSTPEKEEALLHNAVADFRLLSNFNYIRSFHSGGKRVRLLTRDAGLDRFMNSIKLVGTNEAFNHAQQNYDTASEVTLSRALVPKIATDKQWHRFREAFQAHYQANSKVPPFRRSGFYFELVPPNQR